MGMGMANLKYLAEKGYFTPNCKIMDLGSQNLLNAEPSDIVEFVARYDRGEQSEIIESEASRISYFSFPRAGERTAYISELFDLTNIFYTSYDVCPALKTEIFDLNVEHLPAHYRNFFDLTLNFGTTEHVFHQLNSFRVMHDGMKVGSVAFHQLPSIGWVDHGYFTYHWTFFEDLIRANKYELIDTWYTLAGQTSLDIKRVDIRAAETPLKPHSGPTNQANMACYLLNVVLRKTQDAPFSVGLELATSHSALSEAVSDHYGGTAGGLQLGADEYAAYKPRVENETTVVPLPEVALETPAPTEPSPPTEPAPSMEQPSPMAPLSPTGFENVRASELASELVRRIKRRLGA